MDFAIAWRPSAAAASWRLGADGGASAFPPESSVPSVVPRLKRRSEFVRVAREGRAWATPGLILQVLQPDDRNCMQQRTADIRLGITASRKVGNAVARNRVRRRLREAARIVLPANAAKGRHYVVVGRAATLKRPFAKLVSDLRSALLRLGAYRPGGADAPNGAGVKPPR
jgi:ribonuclease P protein component